MAQIEATVEGTAFRNRENGYSVVYVKLEGGKSAAAVGVMPELAAGERVVLEAEWIEHPVYGEQLKVSSCEVKQPEGSGEIEAFLASGIIRGVGPTLAKQIVKRFGDRTLEILDYEPDRLIEVTGIGRKKAEMIIESYEETRRVRAGMIFLQRYGIPAGTCMRIAEIYGEKTGEVVSTNPYRLCRDVEGIGFITADRIAATIGIAPDSEFRLRAALTYVLQEAAGGMGHCWLPEELLLQQTVDLLKVLPELVARELENLALQREVVRQLDGEGGVRVYLPRLEYAEKDVARRLLGLALNEGSIAPRDTERRIARFERQHGISFGDKQREAITQALASRVLVITGGPGTGKTTIIRCIIELLEAEDVDISLCAPTGRAAKRMSEATDREAKTIHRLLEYGGNDESFAHNEDEPLETDCVIVDEMSMVDLSLMRSLLRAMTPGMRLILVGDAHQLPSVGAGNVLGDILASGVIRQVRLTDIYRQEGASRIVVNAHRIDHGEMPLLNEKNTDFFFVREEQQPKAAETILGLVAQRLPKFMKYQGTAEIIRNIQVLAPAKKGECGVFALNTLLQQQLNPPKGQPELRHGENVYREGDKVMQTRNDYELAWQRRTSRGWETGKGVFNGDIGYVTEVDPHDNSVTVLFDEEKEAVYAGSDLEHLDLAYCLSVHKSQGSEFPVVVLPVVGCPPMLQTRNLFYTALTRARSLVVLVGREEIIRRMVENDWVQRRYTTLAERLIDYARLVSE